MGTLTAHGVQPEATPDSLNLPPHQFELLQLVSLSYVPITKGQLLQCLEAALCRDAEDKPWTLTTLSGTVEALTAQGSLVPQGPRVGCEPLLAERVARALVGAPRCQPLMDAIRSVFKIADYRYGYFVRQFPEGVRDLRLAKISASSI